MKSIVYICALLLVCLFNTIIAKDLYKILGLERDATDHAIKKAYRKLSMQYHPDRNAGSKEAHDKYVEINEAYDVLSNPDKRQTFDIDGYEALKKNNQPNPHDPFAMFHGGHHHHPSGRPKGPNAMTEISVTLEQLYNGFTIPLNVERNVLCHKCRGTGAKDGQTQKCHTCHGRGHVLKTQTLGPGFQVQMQQPCNQCHGKGKIAKHSCPICSGRRVVLQKKQFDVKIERGMKHGERVVFERESEQSPTTTPGDIIVTLKQQPHPVFTRNGDDLEMNMNISLKEALLGFTRSIRHLDGRNVVLKHDQVVQPFEVITIKQEGMPQLHVPSNKGNLYVKIHVNMPNSLTSAQRDLVTKLL